MTKRLTRPRRRRIVTVTLVALWLAGVGLLVLWPAQTFVLAPLWPDNPRGASTQYYALGAGEWAIVARRDLERRPSGWRRYEHRIFFNGEAAMNTFLALAAATAALLLAGRLVVTRWRLKGVCDWCGYDLTGATTDRCPECGRGGQTP